MLRPILLASLLLTALVAPIATIRASPDDVRYLGSYWGQNNIREEVAPGDSGARLTIALGSDFDEDSITGIVGRLRLPSVLRSQSISEPSQVESHFPGIIPPGGVFELTFIVNIDVSAQVGVDYEGLLSLTYKVLGDTTRVQTIPLKINIPGRPVLRFSLNTTEIEPGRINFVELVLANEGSAKATDIQIFVQPPSQPAYGLLMDEQPWIVESLPPSGSAKWVIGIYASQMSGDSLMPITVAARYRNAVGLYRDITSILSFYVKKPAVSEANVRVYAEPVRMEPGASHKVSIVLENIGSVAVSDIRVSAEYSGLPVSLIGPSYWSIDRLEPGQRAVVEAAVYSAQMAANGVYQIPLQISFKDSAGNTVSKVVAIAVSVGDIPPKAPNLLIEAEPELVAGRTQTITFTVKNIHLSDLRRISITAQPQNPRLTIIGSNNWLIDSLRPGQAETILLELYAEPELAGTSTSIQLSATYVIGETGEQASEQRAVGFVVQGYIILRIYDTKVIFIGGEPYLSGNIINEGISDALFSTIHLNSNSGAKSSVFVGEIKPNAPLPFNLRLNSRDERFQGEIIIEYKDIFRRNYSTAFQVDVEIPRPVGETKQESWPEWVVPALVAVGVLAALISGYLYLRRRKRSEAG
ncbi:MAG: hypothetical protein QXM16_02355 [Nitrososphaerota archaeon]